MRWDNRTSLGIAAVVAPLSILILAPIKAFLGSYTTRSLSLGLSYDLFLLVVGYCEIVLLGVPAYKFLRKRNLATIWTSAAIGLVCAWLPIVAGFSLFFSSGRGPGPSPGFISLVRVILGMSSILAVPLSTIGILVGVVFWAIARTGREAPETSN